MHSSVAETKDNNIEVVLPPFHFPNLGRGPFPVLSPHSALSVAVGPLYSSWTAWEAIDFGAF